MQTKRLSPVEFLAINDTLLDKGGLILPHDQIELGIFHSPQ